jgi:tetratricopeptide (TPR) repeat protein
MWELPAVALVGLALLALATTGVGAGDRAMQRARVPPKVLRGAVVLAALAAIGAQTILMLAHLKIESSQAAVRNGQPAKAIALALDARAIEPWAATPYTQLALIEEDLRNFTAARAWIRSAIERNREDWVLWVIRARIETKAGAIAAARTTLARARLLNPLEVPSASPRR